MKEFGDRKFYQNINGTSVFVIGWMALVAWILETSFKLMLKPNTQHSYNNVQLI